MSGERYMTDDELRKFVLGVVDGHIFTHHRTPEGHAAFDDGRSCRYCGESALMVLDEWNRALRAAQRGPCAQCAEDVPLAKAAVLSILAELSSRFMERPELLKAVNAVVELYAPEQCEPVSPPANPEG